MSERINRENGKMAAAEQVRQGQGKACILLWLPLLLGIAGLMLGSRLLPQDAGGGGYSIAFLLLWGGLAGFAAGYRQPSCWRRQGFRQGIGIWLLLAGVILSLAPVLATLMVLGGSGALVLFGSMTGALWGASVRDAWVRFRQLQEHSKAEAENPDTA